MSCWVVPQVAAEIWGVHVDRIWNAVRDGFLKTMEENGWMFVDVAPDSPQMQAATARWAGSPWTQNVLTREEHDAIAEPIVVEEPIEAQPIMADDQVEHVEELGQVEETMEELEALQPVGVIQGDFSESEETVNEQEQPEVLADFRRMRNQIARTRIPPLAQAA